MEGMEGQNKYLEAKSDLGKWRYKEIRRWKEVEGSPLTLNKKINHLGETTGAFIHDG